MDEQEYKKESEGITKHIRAETDKAIELIEDFGIISAVRSLKRMVEVVDHFKNRMLSE